MSEPFDIFADSIQVVSSQFSGLFNLLLSSPIPAVSGALPEQERLGTVRISLETMKMLTILLYRQIKQIEGAVGAEIPISAQALDAIQVGVDEWQKFWRQPETE
jgi:hypothetical protein